MLDRRGWYATRIAINLALLAAGCAAVAVLGDSWWQLGTAAYLAVVFTQLAFVGHDAGHRQLFGSRRANDLVGLLHANLLVGISFGWWVPKHNRHHTNPNHEDLDPDISITALAFTPDQASSRHGLIRLLAPAMSPRWCWCCPRRRRWRSSWFSRGCSASIWAVRSPQPQGHAHPHPRR